MKNVRKSLKLSKPDGKLKRKCKESIENEESDELNTSKRRKVIATKAKRSSKTKPVPTNRTGQKYNLRTRKWSLGC